MILNTQQETKLIDMMSQEKLSRPISFSGHSGNVRGSVSERVAAVREHDKPNKDGSCNGGWGN